MTSSHGKELGVRRRRGRVPTVTHSASRGPSSGMDKSRIMCSQWMGSQIPQEKNKSPVGEKRGRFGGGHEGEMEREMERKGRSWKRNVHNATKHLGTCRARQVDTETKWPLSVLAGGWRGMKDLNLAEFIYRSAPIYWLGRVILKMMKNMLDLLEVFARA